MGADLPSNATVLVVEDDEHVRTLLRVALEDEGYAVVTAANGFEALTVARAHAAAVDVLVADVVMPHMGGHALFDELRRHNPGLEVVFISGYAESGPRCDAAFLATPFAIEELTRTVRRLLSE